MANVNTSEVHYPSSKADRNKVRQQMAEAVNCLIRIDDQREALKDIIAVIHEDHNMNKKTIRKLINARYKRNKDEIIAETSEFEDAYEQLFEEAGSNTDVDAADDWREGDDDKNDVDDGKDATDKLSVGTEED